ncbi:MAG: HAMP domain-containing protein [Spirochaetaceae bacterium]|nr:HAMP domain-containing protein [Spirochaetaceae bacterium]
MFRLRSKILLAFSAIILSGTILMVSIINFSTRSGYETFVRQNDIDFSENLKEIFAEYYILQQSWTGVESILQFAPPNMGQNRRMMNHNQPGIPPARIMMPQVILADTQGQILVNTDPGSMFRERHMDKTLLDSGTKIMAHNKVVGYVFAGSMIVQGLDKKEERYLNRTTAIIIFVSLFILLISIVFSYFFSGRLARPVSAMTAAVATIQKGDFSRRVAVQGRDELADLSNSFNKMAESLENNDKWRKQIIADSAHELRTPVSLIQGNLEMILDGVYKPDREHLENIYDETLVLSRLIKELQQLSSAESGAMSLNLEELDLNALIDKVLNIFKAGEVKDKITLINSIETVLPPVEGDFQKLKQVFANVLSNAFRHTPEEGTVEIQAVVGEKEVTVIVKDSGSGIDEEDLEKIFERFYRTDKSRNRSHGGSGLGLSISREIIKLHNGSISAESDKNDRGTSIFISLPFKNQKS